VATLVGDVKISRGENQLNGGYAEVNLNTGVSRLLGAPPDSDAKARVRGLLRPRKDGLDASRQ
jgi:lipopolysaccharide export system protein LptA